MNVEQLPNLDYDELCARLDTQLGEVVEGYDGAPVVVPRVLPAATYLAVPYVERRVWCHFRGIYGLPTTELVDWLRTYIRGRSALEIGAAHGVFGAALGIPATDSFIQVGEGLDYYQATGQPVVPYASRVEQIEAVKAVQKYRPAVVFGSWVTQRGDEGQACMYGVDERKILARSHVRAYVVLGVKSTHKSKSIRQEVPKGWRYREVASPAFLSRVAKPSYLFVWERI